MPTTQYKTDVFYPHKNWYKHQNVLKVIKFFTRSHPVVLY